MRLTLILTQEIDEDDNCELYWRVEVAEYPDVLGYAPDVYDAAGIAVESVIELMKF